MLTSPPTHFASTSNSKKKRPVILSTLGLLFFCNKGQFTQVGYGPCQWSKARVESGAPALTADGAVLLASSSQLPLASKKNSGARPVFPDGRPVAFCYCSGIVLLALTYDVRSHDSIEAICS